MKKQGILKVISLLTIVGFFIAPLALAANYGLDESAGKAKYDVSGSTDVYSMAGTIIQGILAVLAILFFIYVTYAGFLWMKARGNATMVEEAKSTLYEAVIGLVVIMSAYGLTTFVIERLGR